MGSIFVHCGVAVGIIKSVILFLNQRCKITTSPAGQERVGERVGIAKINFKINMLFHIPSP